MKQNILKQPQSFNNIAEIFNISHHKHSFTYDLDNNNKISSFDVLVINNNGIVETNRFRKQTYSEKVLHFLSNHTTHQKNYGI